MQVKKQQLEHYMEQQTSSKLGKESIRAVHCHSAYLTYMQSTSLEMPGCMNQKLESRLPEEISITSDINKHPQSQSYIYFFYSCMNVRVGPKKAKC